MGYRPGQLLHHAAAARPFAAHENADDGVEFLRVAIVLRLVRVLARAEAAAHVEHGGSVWEALVVQEVVDLVENPVRHPAPHGDAAICPERGRGGASRHRGRRGHARCRSHGTCLGVQGRLTEVARRNDGSLGACARPPRVPCGRKVAFSG